MGILLPINRRFMLFCELNTKLTVNIGDFVGCLHKLQSFRNSMCPLVMSAGTNRYSGTSIIRFHGE